MRPRARRTPHPESRAAQPPLARVRLTSGLRILAEEQVVELLRLPARGADYEGAADHPDVLVEVLFEEVVVGSGVRDLDLLVGGDNEGREAVLEWTPILPMDAMLGAFKELLEQVDDTNGNTR